MFPCYSLHSSHPLLYFPRWWGDRDGEHELSWAATASEFWPASVARGFGWSCDSSSKPIAGQYLSALHVSLCWNCLIQEPESAEQRWGVGFYAHAQKIASEWVIVAQLLPTLCDPMDHGPSGSFVHGILQARILDWVAISFSRPRRECLKKLAGLGATQLTRGSCLLDRKHCSGQRQGLKALRTSGSSMPGGSFLSHPMQPQELFSSPSKPIVQTCHACLLHRAFSDCWPVCQPLTPGPVIQLLNTSVPLASASLPNFC